VSADGAATYEIPIWVSPGRAGIQPTLALAYNSQAGNEWLGPGWSLQGLSRITRCRRTQAKDGDAREIQFKDGDSGDRYCLDGQRLVVSGGSFGAQSVYGADGTEYRTEYDCQAKVISNASDAYGPTSFTVYLKNGQVLTFGGSGTTMLDGKQVSITTGAAHYPNGQTKQQWTEAHSATVRYLWALAEVRDRSGNYLTVDYQLDDDNFGYDLRPTAIKYAGFTAPAGSPVASSTPNRSVEFTYLEAQPDAIETFVSGLRLLRGKRLQAIKIWGPSPTGSKILLRHYDIGYIRSVASGRLLVDTVRECDGKDICKPPTVFAWTKGDTTFTDHAIAKLSPGNLTFTQDIDPNKTPAQWAASWQIADVDGDGRDDLLGVGSSTLFGNAKSFGGPLLVPRDTTLVSGAVGYIEDGVPLPPDRYVDLNGDGIPDHIRLEALVASNPEMGFSPGLRRNAIDLSSPQGFSRLTDTQTYSVLTRPPYALDLDGDGLDDLVQPVPFSNGTWQWQYRLNSAQTFGPWINSMIPHRLPSWMSPTDELFGLAFDATGSGKCSLLVAADEMLQLGPNGLETAKVTLPASGYCEPILLDLNGDGLLDWVTRGPDATIGIAINTGNGFSAPVTWTLPATCQNAYPLFCDPAGGNFAWSKNFGDAANRSSGSGVRVLDFNGDGRQDLLLMVGAPDPAEELSPNKLVVLLSNGRGFVPQTLDVYAGEPSGPGLYKQSQVLDVNGDGLADLAERRDGVLHVYTRNGGKPDLLARVTDGLGAYETFDYVPLTYGSPFYGVGTTACSYPLSCVKSGLWVVINHGIDNGISGERTWSYGYADGRMDRQTGEWLGFASRTIADNALGSNVVVKSDNQTRVGTLYPYARLPSSTVTSERTQVDRSLAAYRTRTQVTDYKLVQPTANSLFVHAKEIDDRVTENKPKIQPKLIRKTLYKATEDNYGNITHLETQAYPIASGIPNGIPTRNEMDVLYDNFAPSWLIGLARHITFANTTPDSQTKARTLEHDYFPTTGLLWKTRIEPQTKNASEVGHSGFFLETTFARTPYGLIREVRQEASGQIRVNSLIYDPDDHAAVVERHNALGHIRHTDYDRGLGLPTLQRDPNNVYLRMEYDGFGRVRLVEPQGGVDREVVYDSDPAGHFRTRITPRDMGSTELLYDRLGREICRSWDGANGSRALIETGYDLAGRVWTVSAPRWVGETYRSEVFEYDNMNRLTKVIHPDFSSRTMSYDGSHAEFFDEKGNRRSIVTDELGRITSSAQTDTANHEVTTKLEYGPFDVLRKVTDPGGNVMTMDYDQLSRVGTIVDPNTGTSTALYDAFGDIKSTTDGAARQTSTVRDLLGRPTTVTTSDGVATFTWDTGAHGLGKLGSTASPLGVTTRDSYNKNGQLESRSWGWTNEGFTFFFGYDGYGRLSGLTFPSAAGKSLSLTWTYTPSGFTKNVTDDASRVVWVVRNRDAAGRVTEEMFRNGMATKRTFDHRGRVHTIVTGQPVPLQVLPQVQNLEYEWELNGNLFRRYEHNGNWAEEFHYDPLNRLTSWDAFNLTANTRVSTTYHFDDLGNMQWHSLPDALAGQDTVYYGYGENRAGPSALTSARIGTNTKSFTYDSVGNQTGAPTGSISYTAFNLPSLINTAGGAVNFRYDAFGRRVNKHSGNDSVVSVGGLYERRTTAGTTTEWFMIPGEGRIVAQMRRSAGGSNPIVSYLHDDNLGSIESITDGQGVAIEQRSYDPLGNRQKPQDRGRPLTTGAISTIRLGFAGQTHDAETGMIDMSARIYDPAIGHFLSADPLVSDPGDGQSWNRYAYVRNNPLTLTDPSGLQASGIERRETESGCVGCGKTTYLGSISNPNPSQTQPTASGASVGDGSARPAAAADDSGRSHAPTAAELQAGGGGGISSNGVGPIPQTFGDFAAASIERKFELLQMSGVPANSIDDRPRPPTAEERLEAINIELEKMTVEAVFYGVIAPAARLGLSPRAAELPTSAYVPLVLRNVAPRLGASSITVAQAVAAGLVRPGGKIESLLNAIEEIFIFRQPKNLAEAGDVLQQALSKTRLEFPPNPYAGVQFQQGFLAFQGVGGETAWMVENGAITVTRGNDVLLHLVTP
jgi:RHS repeat-associated protein